MEYKLINSPHPFSSSVIETILINRGMDKDKISHYLSSSADVDIAPYTDLGEEKIKKSIKLIQNAIEQNLKGIILVDCDCDGFTSAAILANYLYKIYPDWTKDNLDFFFHEGKQHGLEDCIDEVSKYEIVLIPDAGSNDIEYHKILADKGIPCICLDHHLIEQESDYAIVINSQSEPYQNKDLSGAGVVWQFCRGFDKETNNDYANDFLDLVGIGLTADMMSLQSIETKTLINEGFRPLNIKNPFIFNIAKKNSYSIGDKLTSIGAAFYIVPLINAVNRVGTKEEKELLFDSMLVYRTFDKIPSNKRGHKPGEMERKLDQALRMVTNVKRRQDKQVEQDINKLISLIENNNMLEHKVLLFYFDNDKVSGNTRGLLANKFMGKYNRPCLVLTLKDGMYQGSARGCDKVGINDFKSICNGFEETRYTIGHPGAFGIGIPQDKILEFQQYLDNALKNYKLENLYFVDFEFTENNLDVNAMIEIASHKDLWGKDIDEPFVAYKGKITSDMINKYKRETCVIKISNDFSIVRFNIRPEDYELLMKNDEFIITAVGRCAKNEYCGKVSAQLLLEDFSINADYSPIEENKSEEVCYWTVF